MLTVLANSCCVNVGSRNFHNGAIFLPSPKQYKISRKILVSGILLLVFVMTCLNVISAKLSEVDPSLWPELCVFYSSIRILAKFITTFTYSLIFKQRPEAMELLKIPNVYYFPTSFMLKMFLTINNLLKHFSSLRVSNYSQIIYKFNFSSDPLGTHLSHAVHSPKAV
uniref:Vomeronasal type-2 receptor 26 n=1 Tax=Heterorhabditis bacteriophora TaxID=37862 RepID=A0A1I7XVT2_HETBA